MQMGCAYSDLHYRNKQSCAKCRIVGDFVPEASGKEETVNDSLRSVRYF